MATKTDVQSQRTDEHTYPTVPTAGSLIGMQTMLKKRRDSMKRFMIERNIPNVGSLSGEELKGAAGASCSALDNLAPKVQWQHSYVAGNKTFCVYLAENEDFVRKHAQQSGFPADIITEVPKIIDPITANQ